MPSPFKLDEVNTIYIKKIYSNSNKQKQNPKESGSSPYVLIVNSLFQNLLNRHYQISFMRVNWYSSSSTNMKLSSYNWVSDIQRKYNNPIKLNQKVNSKFSNSQHIIFPVANQIDSK